MALYRFSETDVNLSFLLKLNMRTLFYLIIVILLVSNTGCFDHGRSIFVPEKYPVSTQFVMGVAGKAGVQTGIYRDTEGNPFGYYEYLPQDFDVNNKKQYPLIFYWNGANAISGNGQNELGKLLMQGLPETIYNGQHYPAIIISGMMEKWHVDDIHPFVEYILKRYEAHYDASRVYMTGFSAGGGLTVRYVSQYPEKFAAIVPIAGKTPEFEISLPEPGMAQVSSWFFHNTGDTVVAVRHSTMWHEVLKMMGGERKLTLGDSKEHHLWREVYADQSMWDWLFTQRN